MNRPYPLSTPSARVPPRSGSCTRVHAGIRHQVADHQCTEQLLEWEIGSGQNEALKAHARQVLPTVLDHPAHAQRLVDKLAVATDA